MFLKNLLLVKKAIQSNFDNLKLPYKLIFSLTKECHSKCKNCNIWKVTPQNELTLDEITKIAQNSSFLSWLNLTGGEPTDRSDFVEIISAFIRYCPDLALINFPTNGINTKKIISKCRQIEELPQVPKVVVIVSLDGPPEVNDYLRGIKNDFNYAVETYKELKKLKKIKAMIGMTLYESNHKLIDETVSAIRKSIPNFSYSDLHLNIQSSSAHLYGNKENNYEKNLQFANSIDHFLEKRGWHYFNPLQILERGFLKRVRPYLETGKTPIDCSAIKSSIYLSEKGEVFPCTIWSELLGNIRNHSYSLSHILNNKEAIQPLKEKILKKDCPNCWSPCEASQSIIAQTLKL